MRINKVINKEKIPYTFIFYQILLTHSSIKMYEDQFGEFVCGFWDLKG